MSGRLDSNQRPPTPEAGALTGLRYTPNKELINYLTKNQEESADSIWKSEIFGRSLDAIVQEGIQAKLSLMPDNLRYKLQSTLCKVVNKGSNNMIAIVL